MGEEGGSHVAPELLVHWRSPFPPNNIHSPNNNPRCRALTSIGLFASSIPDIVRMLTVNLVKGLNNSKTKVGKHKTTIGLVESKSKPVLQPRSAEGLQTKRCLCCHGHQITKHALFFVCVIGNVLYS